MMLNSSLPSIDPTVSCSLQSDDVFGPVVKGCRQDFDFTLLFEQSILSLLPSALFLLVIPPRILSLYKKSVKTLPNRVWPAKLVVTIALAALQLALLVLWIKHPYSRTRISIAAATLGLIVDIELVALSHLEHTRSIRPSSLLNVYLLLSIVLDLAQTRTLWLRHDQTSISAVFSAIIGIKLALLLLESQAKRSYLKPIYQQLSPEATSGIFSRSFFWWLNGLFLKSFRNLLTFNDLYVLDTELAAEKLGTRFQQAWDCRCNAPPRNQDSEIEVNRALARPERRFAIAWSICRCLWWPLMRVVFPRACLIGFTFSQPFLITRTLDLLGQPYTEISRNDGYGLIAAAALIYIGLALSNLHYNHNLYRFITMFRAGTVAMVYGRTLILQDGIYDDSAALTLMSTDVDQIEQGILMLNEVWAQAIQVAIAMYLLARQMGWVCIIPILVVVLSSVGSSQVTRLIGGRQKRWVQAVQRRVGITSSMLADMRSVRMMGLSNVMTSIIQEQRKRETEHMAGYRWMVLWRNVIANWPILLGPPLTFSVYAIQATITGSNSIGTTQAFTSLSIITLLTQPASILLSSVPSLVACTGCIDRLQKFLTAPSWTDERACPNVQSRLDPVEQTSSSTSAIQLRILPTKRSEMTPLVRIENIDVKPASDAETVLHGISFDIERGSLVFIAGPVGAGKSTLLKAILGEIPCEKGSICVTTTRMAYCSQTPWLPNCTVQKAIIGPAADLVIDERWYQAVIHACALDFDISVMPDGDQSVIGNNGITLSGGQKQRIALARAVYARHEMLVLDDIMSALDSKTQGLIADRLLGSNGLFKRTNSTVIIVTHATQYLPLADKVVVLSSSGQISYQGSYQHILQEGFTNATLPFVETAPDGVVETPKDLETTRANKLASTSEVQDLTRQTGDLSVYKYYLRSIGWPLALSTLFFVALSAFGESFSQVWLKWWTDKDGGDISLYISVYVFLGVFSSLGNGGYIWVILILISPKTARDLHSILLRTVMRATQSFLAETDSGTILNRFSQDMTLIEGSLAIGVLITLSNGFSTLAQAALISTGSSYMAITVPGLVAAVYVLQKIYLRTSRQLRYLDLEARSPLYSHFTETLSGLSTIRAFGWQEAETARNIKYLDASQRPFYLLFCIQRWLTLVLDLMVAGLAVIVIALAVCLRSSTAVGLLGVSLNNVLSFGSTLSSLVTGWTQLETSLGAIARLKNFESETPCEDRECEMTEPPPGWPSQGRIEFRNVTASHNPKAIALRNVSFEISAGQKIGICGRTGSGKSSLVGTLLRLLEIDSGSIYVDDLDLSTIPRESIRSRFITIPQDALVFNGDVGLNADPSGTSTDAEIIAALSTVGLWETLQARGGLDAALTLQTLSKGQSQLFALARAILCARSTHSPRGRILLLDEATSNVDSATDHVMQRVIRDEFRGYTILTVAHRLHTIMDSDRIAVIEGGRLADFASPEELMRREDGALQRLQGR